jgi:aspartate/methionine/tyrosine aminotransferase
MEEYSVHHVAAGEAEQTLSTPRNFRTPRRMEAVQTPIIPVVADLIRRHPGTISLGQGIVYYGPPPQAEQKIAEFFRTPEIHKYKPVHGIPELVSAFTEKLRIENQTNVGSERALFVTAGSNLAFASVIFAITDPGDEIILQTPYYFNHEMAITMANARPVLARTLDNYQLDLEAVRAAITPKTKAIVTISPNNPSGAVYPESDLRAVNALCAERGIYHIHDEAYEYFVYDGARHFSPASMSGMEEHTISLYSLSKAYGFASWRVGFALVPAGLRESMNKILDTLQICAPVIAQYAAIGCLEAGAAYCRDKQQETVAVRQLVLRALSQFGDAVEAPEARGAFYFLIRPRTKLKPIEIVEQLISKNRVAVVPGTAFGLEDRCALRISYGSLTTETAREGLQRLTDGLSKILH